jgi:ribosomal-protein-alanine N-acetyltransferase
MESRIELGTQMTAQETTQTAPTPRMTPAVHVLPTGRVTLAVAHVTPTTRVTPTVTTEWQRALPVLQADGITLRELRMSDAPALLALLTVEEVARFISPPPSTVEGFEQFIAWAGRERAAGRYLCFAVVPEGYDTAVGLFQVRQLDSTFGTAEWGFAIGSAFWGSGLFVQGAKLVLEFVFEVIGVYRLEARAAVENGRGNGALRKVGAVPEGILRKSFLRSGQYLDQALWAIVKEDWYRSKAVWGATPSETNATRKGRRSSDSPPALFRAAVNSL